MRLDQRSVTAGYRVATLKMTAELEAFKQQAALDYFQLRRELDAALEQVRATRLEFLNFKAAVTHDKQQLSEIYRLRDIANAQIAERDPAQLLQTTASLVAHRGRSSTKSWPVSTK
jgi:hypothetical protein